MVGVDVGGTFTDVVVSVDGRLVTWKVPTTPDDQSAGFEAGVREALDIAGAPGVARIAHGTTVATNAVLERRGAVTGFLATAGFADLLAIGRQNRPSLYDFWVDRPDPVVPRARCAGVPERVLPDGAVEVALDEDAARSAIATLVEAGVESLAVCLLFSFANPGHERRLAALAAEVAPGIRVSLSSSVSPEFREYERASTTALDAYVGPVVERYLDRLAQRCTDLGAGVVVMRSGGATMTLDEAARAPVHTVLSGPAAGVRGALVAAAASGFADLVTFDMGGTSTDVCLIEGGTPAVDSETELGGLPVRIPALAIHTVGAGGGSILWLDAAGALRAGPESAGAEPGPACYGRGGERPTVTDAQVVAGHLDPDHFLGGRLGLDAGAAERALATLAGPLGVPVAEVAAAGLRVVEAQMARAIRVVTVERGRDPRGFALVAFGGAGPMHACALASALEIATVLIPPSAGALSALGLLAAPLAADVALTRPMVDPFLKDVEAVLDQLAAEAADGLRRQGAEPAVTEARIDCRYRGQAHEVSVPFTSLAELAELPAAFGAAHQARYGWEAPGDPVELVTFRVRALGPEPALPLPPVPESHRVRVEGPACLWGDHATVVVEPGWAGEVDGVGTLILQRA
ncbi:MAG TPA: hydantoinase/oxoprolinase family protein [Actinomycetota bacterium]|nr:hydantoinase/oxoprolinase family protein [Actinomycetota bacterium]